MDGKTQNRAEVWTVMRQGSLLDMIAGQKIAGVAALMPAMRAAMNRVAGQDSEGRKLLVDRIKTVAKREGVSLGRAFGKDVLDKWLQP